MRKGMVAPFVFVWSHLRGMVGFSRGPSEPTLEDFRLELAELGLLRRGFGPEQYRVALEKHLGIEILVEELPDAEGEALAGQLAKEGNLAEVVYDAESHNAVVLIRKSLRYMPWPAYELSLFHELSHLAAGHPLKVKRAWDYGWRREFAQVKLAALGPPTRGRGVKLEELVEEVFEPEARKRAKWLLLAGTCPDVLEAYRLDQFT